MDADPRWSQLQTQQTNGQSTGMMAVACDTRRSRRLRAPMSPALLLRGPFIPAIYRMEGTIDTVAASRRHQSSWTRRCISLPPPTASLHLILRLDGSVGLMTLRSTAHGTMATV